MLKKIIIILAVLIALAAILSLTVFREYLVAVFYIDHMEQEGRTSRLHIDTVMKRLELRKNMSVADIGAGSGLFTFKMAERVKPHGTVYAVDINRKLLDHIDKAAKNRGIENIAAVHATESDPRIPAKVDLIFICDTLHYIKDPDRYVLTMGSYLNKGGRIAVIDFNKNWPPMSIRFSEKDLEAWMARAGLKLERNYDFIINEYMMIFKK